jgi:hypothetical protein
MIFLYRPVIAAPPDGGDYLLILRPEIPVTVRGAGGVGTYSGLVDTGSDNTIFPLSIAEDLGVKVTAASGPMASTFGGQRIQLYQGEVELELKTDEPAEVIRWPATVFFHDFEAVADETVVLGHADFLNYFTATFDGLAGELTLIANEDLPR